MLPPQALPPEYKDVFDAIISEAYRAEGTRDKIAHASWAITDQLPDALLMISPKIRATYMRQYSAERTATKKGKRPKYPLFQWDQVYVYKQKDFTSAFDRVHRTLKNILALTPLLNPDCPRRAQRFAALSSEPHIQELLRRKKA
jgi:hypothetical protein